jgi:F0F1-type ATP synthase assembly protein I
MVWATRVTSIAMQMAVPPGLGYLADRKWGTSPWLTVVGACLGCIMFVMEIVRLSQGVAAGQPRRPAKSPEPPPRDHRSSQ